jgi:uncharacterized protein YycO
MPGTVAGQIGLVYYTGFHPLSHAIARWTRSPVSHTVIAINETECVGAEPKGARRRPISYFGHVIWSRFDYTDEQRAIVVDFAERRIGVPYSYLTDAAIAAAFLLHRRTPKVIEDYLSSDYVYECAQLADAALLAAGIHAFDDGRLPGTVYPGSFVPLYRRNGWMR